MKWCELREYKWNEYVTIAVNRKLSNCEKARKKRISGLQRDSNPWPLRFSAAVLYQPELWRPINWWPANLLSSSTRERNETQNEMMWTAGIQMKWVCDHRSESQVYSRSSHHFILCFIPALSWLAHSFSALSWLAHFFLPSRDWCVSILRSSVGRVQMKQSTRSWHARKFCTTLQCSSFASFRHFGVFRMVTWIFQASETMIFLSQW